MQLSLWPDATFGGNRARNYNRRDTYAVYRGTPQWKERRMEITELQRHRCAGCGSQERLHVHHRHYRTLKNEFPTDLVALCARCHRREHPSWA